MSERRTIAHKAVTIAALVVSVAALPFSVKICHAALIVLLITWALEGHWRAKIETVRQSLLLQLIMAFFFVQLAGLAFSENLAEGWLSVEKKIFLLFVPLALATTPIRLDKKEVKWIALAFMGACLIGTLLCISAAWHQSEMFEQGKTEPNPYLATSSYFALNPLTPRTWLFFSYIGLSEGIGIHPTYFSLYLGFCVIFLLSQLPLLKSTVARASTGLLVFYFSTFIAFLSSRVMILALAIIFAAVLVRSIMTRRRSTTAVTLAIALVFTAVLLLNPVARYRSLQEISYTTFNIKAGHEYQDAAHIRFSLWWLALKSLSNANPWVGWGTGDVKAAMAQTSQEYQITNVIHSHDPHNQFLYTWLANGYPGFLLLLLCFGVSGWLAWQQRDYLLLGFTFIFFLLCLTESGLELQKGIVFYAIFFPLLFFHLRAFQGVTVTLRSMLHAPH